MKKFQLNNAFDFINFDDGIIIKIEENKKNFESDDFINFINIDDELIINIKNKKNKELSDEERENLEKFYKYKSMVKKNSKERYILEKEIGHGGYSNVYLAQDNKTNTKVAIKVINKFHTRGNKIKSEKIIRETKILNEIQGGPNIIKLLDFAKDKDSKQSYFVFEYIENSDFRELYPKLTDYDIRLYLYKVLQALEYAHSKKIMHRDVKPHNIVINHDKKEVKLIDWGLAEFYDPEEEYNVKVSSKSYKGPELLLGYEKYDYSLDMWSFGCVMAGIIFKKDPFFKGKDDKDQLRKIVSVIGSEELNKYKESIFEPSYESESCSESCSDSDSSSDSDLDEYEKTPWEDFVKKNNEDRCNPDAIDLIDKLLKINHKERIMPKEALQHKYFDCVRNTK